MAFKDILGNNRVKSILKKALQRGRCPNSLLFSGPEGVGKKDIALVVAKAMNCLQLSDDACEECESCKAINNGRFPDVMMFSPPKEIIKIDQMRQLKHAAYLKPMIGKRRVFIVEEAEKMNAEASNSLLKVLEEPPSFSHIILIANNPYLVIPTIKSRCQILSFSPISREDIESVLLEKGFEKEQAKMISLIVRGNMKQAMNLDWEEVQTKRNLALQFFISLLTKENAASFLESFSSTRSLDRLELEQIFDILSSFGRDLILLKEEGDIRFLMNPDYMEEIKRTASLLSHKQVMDFLGKIDYAIYALQKNLNVNLLVASIFSDFMEWKNA